MAGREQDSSGAIGGFLFGAAVGAVIGLLKAPSSGADLRARIQGRAGGLASSARERIPGASGPNQSPSSPDDGLVIKPADAVSEQ